MSVYADAKATTQAKAKQALIATPSGMQQRAVAALPASIGGSESSLTTLGYPTRSSMQARRAYAYFRSWVYVCFPCGTPVETPDGIRHIDELYPGDAVISASGTVERVERVGCRTATELVSLCPYGLPEIQSTPEHPFLVLSNGELLWKQAGEVLQTDVLTSPLLKTGHDVASVCVDIIEPTKRTSSITIDIDNDIAWLCGIFLAEGFINCGAGGSGRIFPKSVRFAFHEDEADYIAQVQALLLRKFGLKSCVYRSRGKCVIVVVNSRMLCDFFLQHFGSGATTKVVPTWAFGLSRRHIAEMIRGYFDGDGTICRGGKVISAVTASIDLAVGIRRLCSSLGIWASVKMIPAVEDVIICGRHTTRREHVSIKLTGAHSLHAIDAIYEKHIEYKNGVGRASPPVSAGTSKQWTDGTYWYIPIKSVGLTKCNATDVFNLEVSGDHTYVAGFVNVHNCVNAIARRLAGQPWGVGVMHGTTTEDKPDKRRAMPEHKAALRRLQRLGLFKAASSEVELEVLQQHELLDMLAKPNALQRKFEFLYLSTASILLTGECYWIAGEVDGEFEMWAVPAHWIEPIHEGKLFSGYNLVMDQAGGQKISLPPEAVARTYLPDPHDLKSAYSPLQAVIRSISVDEAIVESQAQLFQRGIFPNLILTVGRVRGADGKLTDRRPVLSGAQRSQVIRAVRQIWNQTVNAGDPAILDGLIESVHKLHSTPQEMDWQTSSDIVRKRIMQAFGLNPIVVGEMENANRAQSVEAEKSVASNCVNPLINAFSETATEWLGPMFEENEKLEVWIEPAEPIDPDLQFTRWNSARTNNDVSRNEFRAEILGLPPIEEEVENSRNPLLDNPTGVASAVQIAAAVSQGQIARESGIAILRTFFQLDEETAEAIVGEELPEEEQAEPVPAAEPEPVGGYEQELPEEPIGEPVPDEGEEPIRAAKGNPHHDALGRFSGGGGGGSGSGEGSGDGGGSSGGSSDSGSGASEPVATGTSASNEAVVQQWERRRDREEGTQAEADRQVTKAKSKVDKLKAQKEALETAITQVDEAKRQTLENVSNIFSARMSEITARQEQLRKEGEEGKKRMEELKAKLASMRKLPKRRRSADGEVDLVNDEALNELAKEWDQTLDKLDAVITQLGELSERAETLTDEIRKVIDRIEQEAKAFIAKSLSTLTRIGIKALAARQAEHVQQVAAKRIERYFDATVGETIDRLEQQLFVPNPAMAEEQAETQIAKAFDESAAYDDLAEIASPVLAWGVVQGATAESEIRKAAMDLRTKDRTPEQIAELLEGIELPDGVTFDDYPEWLQEAAKAFIEESFDQDYWQEIIKTTRNDIKRTLERGISDGYSIADIVKEIRKKHGEAYSKARATNVARTECTGAMNFGHSENMNQLEQELGIEVRSEWVSVIGSTTRPTHAEMDGQISDDEKMFTLSGYRVPYPGHYSLPPDERCHCQCAVIAAPVMEEIGKASLVDAKHIQAEAEGEATDTTTETNAE